MKVDGQCFCGFVAFTAEIDPESVELCHCADCQRFTSSAFRIVVAALPGSFALTAGKPTIFTKLAESGRKRDQAFCPKCGTSIYSGPSGGGSGFLGLRAGCLRQRLELAPVNQYWRRSALNWVDRVGAIPAHETE